MHDDIASAPTYSRPWATSLTDRGRIGRDCRSRIVDADGRHIVTIGHGSNIPTELAAEEYIADLIVTAVNAYLTPAGELHAR